MTAQAIIDKLWERLKQPPPRKVWDRFWSNVTPRGPHNCWVWRGSLRSGYASFSSKFSDGSRGHSGHRTLFIWLYGPPEDGLVLDHYVCDNKPCVNPFHLHPCSHGDNSRRGFQRRTHCRQGHALIKENLWSRSPVGQRVCGICIKEREQSYRVYRRTTREIGT